MMYDYEQDQPAQCHTSDINEELGQVTHLFTDKTGTLTRNEMMLKMYSMNGVVRMVGEDPFTDWNWFMKVMVICHSVQVLDGHFVASSPDEKAILELCKEQGFEFLHESLDKKVKIMVGEEEHVFEKLTEQVIKVVMRKG